jgi:2-succinyl-5-enolpyruvyl-6-hydroxy-3-cyclohexene-1-carboxylate synthase
MVSEDGDVHDVTMHMNTMLISSAEDVLTAISEHKGNNIDTEFHARWNGEINRCKSQFLPISSENIHEETVRLFEQEIDKRSEKCHVHYANSTSVRYGCLYATHYIYVNRGVNGIEGSLSTAAGYSVAVNEKTFIVTGDLSFFYDANALWNKNLKNNLRIILLNNGCGGIFSKLKGLENSPSRDDCVAASHNTSAKGLCMAYGVEYLAASSREELSACLTMLFDKETDSPMLLEVG